MKLKRLCLFLFAGLVSAANAESYKCTAKANPNRGFGFNFTISVTSTVVGGDIVMKANGQEKVLGKVSSVDTISAENPDQQPVFDMTLGYIAEEDVSGVPAAALDKVSSIEVFRAELLGGDEAFVYKLFAQSQQVGGTVLISGRGTACLP